MLCAGVRCAQLCKNALCRSLGTQRLRQMILDLNTERLVIKKLVISLTSWPNRAGINVPRELNKAI